MKGMGEAEGCVVGRGGWVWLGSSSRRAKGVTPWDGFLFIVRFFDFFFFTTNGSTRGKG